MAALKWGDLVSKILKPNAPLSSGEVAALLVKLSAEDVTECIAEQCALGRDVVALVRAVFSGLRDDEDGAEVRLLVLKKLLEFLASSSLWTEQQLSDCVSLLITEIAKLPTQDDTRLYELTVELVNLWHGKSAVVWGACRCFDVLPHLCKRLAAVELRDAAGAGAAPCSGPELCEQLLNSIINLPKWPREPLYKMLEALRDVPLAPLTLRHLCNRIGDLFADIPLTDMPVLVESFVKYSTRGFRVNILQRIIRAFDSLNQRSLDAAASVSSSSSSSSSQMVGVAPPPLSREQFEMEATALLFIETQFTQDQELGREFLDDLKKTSLLTPFTIALVLCLARIQRFKEQSFDLLRNVIVASCKHAQHRKQSPWLAAVAPRCTAAHLATTLRQTIVFMAEGAWPIQESMVELGFLLGDCVAPKQVAEIGETILVALFELQASARSAILDSIVTRIDAHSKSAAFYAGMLEKAIHVAPEHAASSITPKIRELFYYLSMLEPKIARILLRAVSSLIRSSTQLFDHVVLVLRKAMFSRESSARLIAVEGFLELLACLHTSEPHPSDPNRSIAQVQYEILGTSRERERERERETANTCGIPLFSSLYTGFLRRCLTQQYEIRNLLYSGLPKIFKSSPSARPQILELLHSQLERYCREGEPPSLADCLERPTQANSAGEARIVEPLHKLLSCIHQCLESESNEARDPRSTYARLAGHMQAISLFLIETDLEHYELDKSSDFAATSLDGQYNLLHGSLLYSVCEAMMEWEFSQTGIEPYQRAERLFNKTKELLEHVRLSLAPPTQAARSKPGARPKCPIGKDSVLSLEVVTLVITETVKSEQDNEPNEVAQFVRAASDQTLYPYLFKVAHDYVKLVRLSLSLSLSLSRCVPFYSELMVTRTLNSLRNVTHPQRLPSLSHSRHLQLRAPSRSRTPTTTGTSRLSRESCWLPSTHLWSRVSGLAPTRFHASSRTRATLR